MNKTFIVAAVALLGFAAMGATSSDTAEATQNDKVWVCHANSGRGELKNGYDLIHVNVASVQYEAHLAHSLPGGEKVNTKFGDAPNYFLYDYIDVSPANLPGKCGAPAPPDTVVTPTEPTATPTCDAPGEVVLPTKEGLEYSKGPGTDGSVVVTVVAADGYVLAQGSTTSWTFAAKDLAKLPAGSAACPATVTPTQPTPPTPVPAEAVVVAALPPTQPAAETAVAAAVPAAAAPTALPATGSESWTILLIGLASLLSGAALVKLSRHPA